MLAFSVAQGMPWHQAPSFLSPLCRTGALRPGLRSRATAARRRDDEPCDLVVPQKALRGSAEKRSELELTGLCGDRVMDGEGDFP